MIRIFIEQDLVIQDSILLDKKRSHYLKNVMRTKIGDNIKIFNGKDGEFLAETILFKGKEVSLKIIKKISPQENSKDLLLLFAPVKTIKTEFLIQKATELGVTIFQPVLTERTIVRKVNEERLLANAIEAAEQCERMDVPEIFSPIKLEEIINKYAEYKIIFCDESAFGERDSCLSLLLKDKQVNNTKYAILTGPEGGFLEKEISFLKKQKNVENVTLGKRVLKAETAIISAISLIAQLRD